MHADGSHQHRLASIAGGDEPRWSPTGMWIVFTRYTTNGTPSVYLVRPDGTDLHRLQTHVGDAADASFSPDGKRVIFDTNAGGNTDLHTTTLTGTQLIRITSTPGLDSAPAWTPPDRPASTPATSSYHGDSLQCGIVRHDDSVREPSVAQNGGHA
jgi:Tol biopolymer transport system component